MNNSWVSWLALKIIIPCTLLQYFTISFYIFDTHHVPPFIFWTYSSLWKYVNGSYVHAYLWQRHLHIFEICENICTCVLCKVTCTTRKYSLKYAHMWPAGKTIQIYTNTITILVVHLLSCIEHECACFGTKFCH